MAWMAEGRMAESCDEPFHKGRVSWFNPDKKFGLVVLDDGRGDAFLHMFAVKAAVSVPLEGQKAATGHVIPHTGRVSVSTFPTGHTLAYSPLRFVRAFKF